MMDGDPAVEAALDSFSLAFPLPYRVAFVIILGMSYNKTFSCQPTKQCRKNALCGALSLGFDELTIDIQNE